MVRSYSRKAVLHPYTKNCESPVRSRVNIPCPCLTIPRPSGAVLETFTPCRVHILRVQSDNTLLTLRYHRPACITIISRQAVKRVARVPNFKRLSTMTSLRFQNPKSGAKIQVIGAGDEAQSTFSEVTHH